MAILLIVVIIFLVLLSGMFLAFLFTRADRAVTVTRDVMAAEERAYSPGVTLGHKIKLEASYEQQLKQARLEAAKKAAATPRGANSQIGRAGQSTLATAGKSVALDAMTAVRIARFHGWDGARTGAPAVSGPAVTAPVASGARVAAAPAIARPTLITITPDMPPEEVRKARVANAKAESAYNKALKAAASGAPTAGVVAAGAAPSATATGVAPAVSVAPPTLIEITPDMAPEEVRKARVANAKANAAYNKALKAAGEIPGAAQPAAVASAPAPAAAMPVAAPIPAGIEPPQLIEITDNMPPEEIRRARVANAKAQSAYNKALKAAGVDPAAVKAGAPTPAAPVAAAAVVEPAPSAAAAPAAAGIAPPQLIDITDDMAPEDVRRARVANAKATAAYNKALKAAGIDPASVK